MGAGPPGWAGGSAPATVDGPHFSPSHQRTYPPLENGSGYHPGCIDMPRA